MELFFKRRGEGEFLLFVRFLVVIRSGRFGPNEFAAQVRDFLYEGFPESPLFWIELESFWRVVVVSIQG